ncbi:plasma membrane H+-ATPase, partial [Podila clonocystis]
MARGYKELLDPDQSHEDSHQHHSQQQQIPSHQGHARNEIELQDLLHTDPKTGLSSMQVHQRLRQFGPNQLVEAKTNQLLKFLTYFVGPIAFLIELACILSAIVK